LKSDFSQQFPFFTQERILREIEEDKMKRRMEREAQTQAKSGSDAPAPAAPPPTPASSSASDPNGKCLIRIRRLDGGQVTEEFLNGDTLKTVYDRIVQKSHAPMGMFDIATPMPRRVYKTHEIAGVTLIQAGLAPRGAIVCEAVLPKPKTGAQHTGY
jgi:hypothetical protein